MKAYIRAIQIKPDDRVALLSKGRTFRALGKHAEALEVYERILEINSEDKLALLALIDKGISLIILGKKEDALKAFNSTLKINSENELAHTYRGFLLGSIGRYEEAVESFEKTLKINTANEFALLYKSFALLELERYSEVLDVTAKLKDIAINESCIIQASLTQAEAYLFLDNMNDAVFAIGQVTQDIAGQKSHIIKIYISICFMISLNKLKEGNHGNAIKLMEMAHDASVGLADGQNTSMVVDFLKNIVKSKDVAIIKIAVDEIIRLYGDACSELLKPIINALDIIESKDINEYYNLQIEEREIVVDIVKDITQSDELLP